MGSSRNLCEYGDKQLSSHGVSHSVVGHGDDEREDEQVDQTDESHRLSFWLVVRSQIVEREPD
jgi:hypothetical protein